MAMRLAEYDNDVIITYHTQKEAADAVVAEIEAAGQKAAALQFDSSDFKSLDNFLERLSQTLQSKWNVSTFDFLINNAGIGMSAGSRKYQSG